MRCSVPTSSIVRGVYAPPSAPNASLIHVTAGGLVRRPRRRRTARTAPARVRRQPAAGRAHDAQALRARHGLGGRAERRSPAAASPRRRRSCPPSSATMSISPFGYRTFRARMRREFSSSSEEARSSPPRPLSTLRGRSLFTFLRRSSSFFGRLFRAIPSAFRRFFQSGAFVRDSRGEDNSPRHERPPPRPLPRVRGHAEGRPGDRRRPLARDRRPQEQARLARGGRPENTRRKERAEDLFAATVEREKNKSSILDKTFKEALERAKADPSKPKGIFDDE